MNKHTQNRLVSAKVLLFSTITLIASPLYAAEEAETPAPATNKLAGNISSQTAHIIGIGDQQRYHSRYVSIQRLKGDAQPADLEAYLQFLGKPLAESPLDVGELAALKNDVADYLLKQKQNPGDLARRFLELLKDSRQTIVWREYILQKLPEAHQNVQSPELRAQLIQALWAHTTDETTVNASTALLSLHRLYTTQAPNADISAKQLESAIHELVNDSDTKAANRATALHLLANLNADAAYRIAQTWLQQDQPATMRMVAAYRVGEHGDAQDRKLLEPLRLHSDIRIRHSAKEALKKLTP